MNAITNRIAMFPAHLDSLADARGFSENFCNEASIADGKRERLGLVVEELFRNTVKHGHRGGSDAPVWIELECEGGAIRLTYEDRARPFNSLAQATSGEGTLSRLLRQDVIGHAEYAHLFGRNRTRLVLAA